MSSLLLTLLLVLLTGAHAKKRLRRSATATATATATIAPVSHATKCRHEGSFSLINVFLNPPTPRKGDKVTLSIFYYAPVEVEDPDLVIATHIADKTFIHKSSLCDNKLTKQEIHNRHLDEEQLPQDDNDGIIGLKRDHISTGDDSDIHQPQMCHIRVGEHMDNIELSWLYDASPPLDITIIYGHEKTPLLCTNLSITPSYIV